MSEPTPLSADKRYPIEIIQGVEGFCIGVNNYRLVGPKPWGGGTVVKRWNVSLADLGRAIPELSATIDAQAAEIAILKDGRCVSCMEPCNPLHPKCACIRAEIAEMEAEIAALKGALTKAIEDMQWMFGGWGITDEDQLANGRVVAHQNIEALRRVLAGKEAQG